MYNYYTIIIIIIIMIKIVNVVSNGVYKDWS